MTNDISFIRNSLYCQYAYIVNLDEGVLECYVGFQKKPQKENRYGTRKRKHICIRKIIVSIFLCLPPDAGDEEKQAYYAPKTQFRSFFSIFGIEL